MRIAFVGVKRKYAELPPDYIESFNRFHLELPFYYARDGKNTVILTTVDHDEHEMDNSEGTQFPGGGALIMWSENAFKQYARDADLDVVIHWRKWFPELHVEGALNLINCQDHSFSGEWKRDVVDAYKTGKLHGILCFPTWHEQNLFDELGGIIPRSRLISGITLGVDTDIYKPADIKLTRELLWSSDPGRGLEGAIELAIKLWQRDRRFRLNLCYPDYAKLPMSLNHPAIRVHGSLKNDVRLWSLFRTSGFLPYTSTFKEPSSRAHRQAQAAGCVVLYPPDMGTPSNLIEDGKTGFVRNVDGWADLIIESLDNGVAEAISKQARELAVSESWAVQSQRFNERIGACLV